MDAPETKVAIVGMAGRFPGAQSVRSFWSTVVREGREAITRYDRNGAPDEPPPGTDSAQWVNAYGHLDRSAWFDNEFFDVSPAEARRMDPQHRLFLETTWTALEDAGVDITTFDGLASVYASSSENAYSRQVEADLDPPTPLQNYAISLGNSRDFLASRVGYKLDLKGECVTVQSACSSSLGAVHLACQSVLTGQSDLAIAGGVSVGAAMTSGHRRGYWAEDGFITSPDGHCRPFTDAANGTVPGEGVGVVVLKPLLDAIDDRDRIYGVVSASSINNDGSRKVGYQAPSLDGQVDVIRDALAFADVAPHEVGYLECHGTGTDIGDAIELRALRKVFETHEAQVMAPIYLGSVKANVGHLDAAAGITSFIKATLALHHGERPPLVHANNEAPHSQLEASDVLAISPDPDAWEAPVGPPRRAGVTSLGIGGTNVHVVLEEAPSGPTVDEAAPGRASSLFVWSAKTNTSLASMTETLAQALDRRQGELDREGVARTLQSGRASFDRRRYLVAESLSDVVDSLQSGSFEEGSDAFSSSPRKTAFLLPGSGAYYDGMAAPLLEAEPALRAYLEDCAERLPDRADFDLIDFLSANENVEIDGEPGLEHRQSAVVAFEYALARLLLDWGCEPDAFMGSSLGEYTAACLSGALSLDDMLSMVWRRGELLDTVAGGGMTLVDASMAEVAERSSVADDLDEAIRISASAVAVSGAEDVLTALEAELDESAVRARRLPPRVAYHSSAIDALRDDFTAALADVEFAEPSIPYVSNYTGDWISEDDLRSPEYWFRQMRHTVRLAEGFQTLYDDGVRLYVEVGPGHGLSKFVNMNFSEQSDVVTAPCLSHPRSERRDGSALASAVGTLWLGGETIDWEAFGDPAPTVDLPTYPFERRHYHVQEERPPDAPAVYVNGEPARGSGGPGDNGRAGNGHEHVTTPRTRLEERIAAVWSDTLGLDRVGVEQDFFDLGGDSFLALELREELTTEFGDTVPDRVFFEQSTVAGMAREAKRMIEDPTAGTADTLVRMKTGPEEAPLVFLHPVGGELFCYRDLVHELESRSFKPAVYGLRAPGLVGDAADPEGIEDMAERIATALTDDIAPDRCRIAGWSFGGLLAYELGARLEAKNVPVADLLMIDTEHPEQIRKQTAREDFVTFQGFVRDLVSVRDGTSETPDFLREVVKGATTEERLRRLSEHMRERRGNAWDIDVLERVYSVYRTNAEAYLRYRPERHSLSGRLTIATAALESSRRDAPSDLGWKALLGESIECITFDADHYGIVHPPAVERLAERVAR